MGEFTEPMRITKKNIALHCMLLRIYWSVDPIKAEFVIVKKDGTMTPCGISHMTFEDTAICQVINPDNDGPMFTYPTVHLGDLRIANLDMRWVASPFVGTSITDMLLKSPSSIVTKIPNGAKQ
jgi:hypothetical protein